VISTVQQYAGWHKSTDLVDKLALRVHEQRKFAQHFQGIDLHELQVYQKLQQLPLQKKSNNQSRLAQAVLY